jgi:hypothetical protein
MKHVVKVRCVVMVEYVMAEYVMVEYIVEYMVGPATAAGMSCRTIV